jgi:ubiquinone biosynthesis protein
VAGRVGISTRCRDTPLVGAHRRDARVRSPEASPIAVRGLGVAIAAAVGGAPGAAPKLRKLFESQGPTYLKLGQMISGGSGLFPQPIIDAFADFRDALPAEPWDHVERVLDEEIPAARADFEASNEHRSQPHQSPKCTPPSCTMAPRSSSRSNDPRSRSDWRRIFDCSQVLRTMPTNSCPRCVPRTCRGIVGYLADTLTQELDFRLEAENMLDVGWSLSKGTTSGGVVAPRPHAELVSRRVLVMERFRGIPSADAERVRQSGVDIEQLMRNGFRSFLEGALLHGVFHGDLHQEMCSCCPMAVTGFWISESSAELTPPADWPSPGY